MYYNFIKFKNIHLKTLSLRLQNIFINVIITIRQLSNHIDNVPLKFKIKKKARFICMRDIHTLFQFKKKI